MRRNRAFERDDQPAGRRAPSSPIPRDDAGMRHPAGPVHDPYPVVLDVAAVRADDDLLDRLRSDVREPLDLFATARPPAPIPAVEPLEGLLSAWRRELVDALPVPPSVGQADWALRRGRRRSLRPLISVAAAICALLLGSAAAGSRLAKPGDALWPLTQVLWSGRAESAQAAALTENEIKVARSALSSGDATMASTALREASKFIIPVQPQDGRGLLDLNLSRLSSQVDSSMGGSTESAASSSKFALGTAATTTGPGTLPIGLTPLPVPRRTSSPGTTGGGAPATPSQADPGSSNGNDPSTSWSTVQGGSSAPVTDGSESTGAPTTTAPTTSGPTTSATTSTPTTTSAPTSPATSSSAETSASSSSESSSETSSGTSVSTSTGISTSEPATSVDPTVTSVPVTGGGLDGTSPATTTSQTPAVAPSSSLVSTPGNQLQTVTSAPAEPTGSAGG